MKKTLFTALAALQLLVAAYTNAQPTQAEIEAMTQQMMQGAAQLQSCFANVDQAALQQLQQRGEQLDAEVRKLCQAGERDQAEQKAIAFAMEMQNDKNLQALRECGEMAMNMMPEMPFADYAAQQAAQQAAAGNTQAHFCDNYQ